MKKYTERIDEIRGQHIDMQWINDEKPVITKDGRQVLVTNVDISEVPNIIHGKVKMKDGKLQDYEWNDIGVCLKAIDNFGNPKMADSSDNLVKAI
jgi:hypothetical protein